MNIYLYLFKTFFKSGWLAIGNSYAALPSVQAALAGPGSGAGRCPDASSGTPLPEGGASRCLTKEEFADSVVVAQALPGVFFLNLSAHVGYRMCGTGGGAAALLGALLPAFLTLLLCATFFLRWRENPGMASFLRGIRPAIVALIVVAGWRMARTAGIDMSNVWLPVVALVAIGILRLSPTYILLLAVVAGMLYGFFLRPADGADASPGQPGSTGREANPDKTEK